MLFAQKLFDEVNVCVCVCSCSMLTLSRVQTQFAKLDHIFNFIINSFNLSHLILLCVTSEATFIGKFAGKLFSFSMQSLCKIFIGTRSKASPYQQRNFNERILFAKKWIWNIKRLISIQSYGQKYTPIEWYLFRFVWSRFFPSHLPLGIISFFNKWTPNSKNQPNVAHDCTYRRGLNLRLIW